MVTAPPAATPTGTLVPHVASPTATTVVPTPIVAGSPAPDLPDAGQISATIPVGLHPRTAAAGHGSIWVQNDVDGTVSRIDPATNTVIATIPITAPIDPSTPATQFLGLKPAQPDLAIDARWVWVVLIGAKVIAS